MKNKKKIKRRGNSRYVVLFLFIALIITALMYAGLCITRKLDFFNIERIVITGNENLNSLLMEELASEHIGENLFSINKKSLIQRYEHIVRVKKAKVIRVLPSKLKIELTERIGYMYVKTKEGILVPVDKEKVILDNFGFFLNEDIPVVNTELSLDALLPGTIIEDEFFDAIMLIHSCIEEHQIDSGSVSEYYLFDGYYHLVEANSGARIRLGKTNVHENIKKLEYICNNSCLEKDSFVDLSFKNQAVIKPVKS